jgi:hypothetical protein
VRKPRIVSKICCWWVSCCTGLRSITRRSRVGEFYLRFTPYADLTFAHSSSQRRSSIHPVRQKLHANLFQPTSILRDRMCSCKVPVPSREGLGGHGLR